MENILTPLFDTLRPYLLPLTSNLPTPLNTLSISLLGPQCHNALLNTFTPDLPCLNLALSKTLGIVIISASAIVKIPQLLKLLSSKSPAGLSFISYALETTAYVISLAYNQRMGFPFSTFGETALIAVQNVVIAALVLEYSGMRGGAAAWVAGIGGLLGVLLREDIVGRGVLGSLMAGAGVLGVVSKVPQIWTVWKEGGTGQLSAFAVGDFPWMTGKIRT
jgi:mannose-P-dolichol utilization defect protein 1